MKVYLLKQLRSLFKPRNLKKSKKLIIYLIFFLITSIVWLFNKIDKNYFYNFYIPVTYTELPENKLQTNPLPDKINVTVYGNGIQILKHKLLSTNTLTININRGYVFLKEYYYETSNLTNELKKYFKEELQIINIEPKIIIMKYEEKKHKIVKVIANISVSNNNFKIDSVKLFPSFVYLSGPSNVISQVNEVYTDKITLNNPICELKQVKINNKLEKCKIIPDKVDIKIFYSIFYNYNLKIPVSKSKNYKSGIQYLEKFINIKLQATSEIHKNTLIDDVIISFDYRFISSNKGYIKINVSTINEKIKIVYFYPQIIKFYY